MVETTLHSERVYQGKIIGVRVDRVRLADGAEATREVVEHTGSAAVLAVDEQDRVLLVSQYRHPVGAHLWEIPAGRLEPGESPHEAAARELGEETHLAGTRLEPLLCVYATPGYCAERLWIFLATGLRPYLARPDADERISVAWFDRREAISMCLDGRITDAKTIAAVLAFNWRAGGGNP